MAKVFFYALVTALIAYVVDKVANLFEFPTYSLLLFGALTEVIFVALISYIVKIKLNQSLKKQTASGLFFGLLACFVYTITYSIDRSMVLGYFHVQVSHVLVGLLLGALIAGKKIT